MVADGLIRCDAPECETAADRATFKADGGVFINHSSFFGTRGVKHACTPACAELVIAELARDLVAYGRRSVPA